MSNFHFILELFIFIIKIIQPSNFIEHRLSATQAIEASLSAHLPIKFEPTAAVMFR